MNGSVTHRHAARLVAALASLGAGAIHVAVVPGHLTTWWASGLFFIVLAAFQLLWAAGVAWTDNRTLLVLGVLVNVGSILLWTLTRIWGQPLGPLAGTPLPVGPSGVLALVLEVVVIGAAVWAARDIGTRRLRGAKAVAPLTAALVGVAALTVPGISAALEHDHAAHAGETGHGDHTGHHEEKDGGHDYAGHHDEPAAPERRTQDGGGNGEQQRTRDGRQSSERQRSPEKKQHDGHGDHDH